MSTPVWTTPKVDWSVEDYFNVSDYERIKGNIEYLYYYANDIIGIRISAPYTLQTATIETVPKIDFFNYVVYDTDYIRNVITGDITLVNYRDMNTYTEKGAGWDYNDLNIIESNILLIKQRLDAIYYAKNMLPFNLFVGEGDDL